MTPPQKRFPQFTLIAGIGLSIGLVIPYLYERIGGHSIAPRESLLLTASICTLALTAIAYVFWMRIGPRWEQTLETEKEPDAKEENPAAGGKSQFGLQRMFAITALIAVALGLGNLFGLAGVCWTVVAAVAAFAMTLNRDARIRVLTLLAALLLPHAWVIRFSKPFGQVTGMLEHLPIYPGLVPGMLIGVLAKVHHDTSLIIGGLLVVPMLLAGIVLALRGGKLATVYFVVMLLLSTLSSMLVHVMYRA